MRQHVQTVVRGTTPVLGQVALRACAWSVPHWSARVHGPQLKGKREPVGLRDRWCDGAIRELYARCALSSCLVTHLPPK